MLVVLIEVVNMRMVGFIGEGVHVDFLCAGGVFDKCGKEKRGHRIRKGILCPLL